MTIQRSVCRIACVALVFAWSGVIDFPAMAQSTAIGKQCDLAVFGEKSTNAFLAFDHDLRHAIETHDDAKLSLLVQYPLRVNDAHGQIFIPNATSLQGHLAQIFTPAIQQAILSSTHDTIGCNYTGIDYGNGKVWINATDHGYFVMSINLPATGPERTPPGRSVQLACHTSDSRIVIDSVQGGTPTYRSWSSSQSVSDSPQMEINSGKVSWEGTGPCGHRIWTFHNDKAEIEVEEPGCTPDQPPPDAQAQLTMNHQGKKEKIAWCF